MSETSSGEKTEKPSAQRLKDAHKRGDVARSRDLAMAIALLAVVFVLAKTGPSVVGRLLARIASGFSHLGDHPLTSLGPNDLATLVMSDLQLMALVTAPLLGTAAVVAVGANLAQSGWVFAPERLQLNWSRLNPASGLARLKPSQSGIELLKTIMAAAVVTALAYGVGRHAILDGGRLSWMNPADAAAEGWGQLLGLLWRAGFALMAMAAADYGLQQWRHYSSLKMTKQEQRDEAKSNEGSPEMKARVRRIQRDMNRQRMLSAVKTATVVVTNPTHYAVAIEYRRDSMAAPVVVAKGRDLMAARIKAIARDRGVPIVENVSLAQALYKGAEVGDVIPAALFGAVAEVLAYLVRIKQLML